MKREIKSRNIRKSKRKSKRNTKRNTKRKSKRNTKRNTKRKSKNKIGGTPQTIVFEKRDIYKNTIELSIGFCVKELIEKSFDLYSSLLDEAKRTNSPTTIVCGGQSPSYYCLAMMNFKIFDEHLVDIVILPHSKNGKVSSYKEQHNENILYCERLKEKNIKMNNYVVIIDGVHSGVGILALESALKHCYQNINVRKIAINYHKDVSQIPVDDTIVLYCEPLFSDSYPRLVNSYFPSDFDKGDKFNTNFINLDTNPLAQMIIDIAKNYPEIPVEDTEWYKLNKSTEEQIELEEKIVKREREIEIKKAQEEVIEERKRNKETFTPIILENPKRYQCPDCKSKSGVGAVKDPEDYDMFTHNFFCNNNGKIPREESTLSDLTENTMK